MDKHENQAFLDLLTCYGLTRRDLSKRFSVPMRTVHSWANGERKPHDYTLKMMRELLESDKRV